MTLRTGIATFTLDEGHCPRWLFERMVRLGREVVEVLIAEYGPKEFVRRISDPVWFQTLGTVLAFDWNASGLTTILTAALKEAIRGREKDFGIFICGGKGKTSRQTPEEIQNWGERINFSPQTSQALVYNSKMAAKVDSALLQDGFQIYHHSFFFSRDGAWAVVQQGMNTQNQSARRYHWFSEKLKFQPTSYEGWSDFRSGCSAPGIPTQGFRKSGGFTKSPSSIPKIPEAEHGASGSQGRIESHAASLVCEPHSGIVSQLKFPFLNLVSKDSGKTRDLSVDLVESGYRTLMNDIEVLRRHSSSLSKMMVVRLRESQLKDFVNPVDLRNPQVQFQGFPDQNNAGQFQIKFLKLNDCEFHHHPVEAEDFSKSKYLEKILAKLCYKKPENYESLLAEEGVGPKTVRALALVGEVIYGAKPSYEDPARYSFAFGGKDRTPYPVDRKTYDETIQIMKKAVNQTRLPFYEKNKIIRRINSN